MVHHAQLHTCDEHDLGSLCPEPLGPLRAVGDQDEDVVGRQFHTA